MPGPREIARHAPKEDGDFWPTPPWATRALVVHLWEHGYAFKGATLLEPMAGAGHMAKTFEEYGAMVSAYDNRRWRGDKFTGNYKTGQRDFLTQPPLPGKWAYVITNPAYADARATARRMFDMATHGMAVLVRVQFLETRDATRLFEVIGEPTQILFFQDRISFKKNVVVRNAPRYFFHIWAFWDKQDPDPRPPIFIPYGSQPRFEKDTDYD